MNHYPRHIGDIAKDTAHLSQGQFGAYDLLMDWYYAHERALPLDKEFIYAITRARDGKERINTDAVLSWFFKENEDGWHQKRCDEELKRYSEKSAKASKSASTRWGNKHAGDMHQECEGNANASETHKEGIQERNASHEPVTNNQSSKTTTRPAVALTCPDGVSETVWKDFTALRKAKRAPLTETALAGIKSEADKAGLTLQAALETCCKRGWQGFDASWLNGSDRQQRQEPSGTMRAVIALENMKGGNAS